MLQGTTLIARFALPAAQHRHHYYSDESVCSTADSMLVMEKLSVLIKLLTQIHAIL
jgi:hypothetical protein